MRNRDCTILTDLQIHLEEAPVYANYGSANQELFFLQASSSKGKNPINQIVQPMIPVATP